ncbi:hypothetical protein Vretimale_15988 [Volvox reticuliferus]|uniref:Protein kinase domain-containing protein n=1 Tax=Volvox reticuliferus TaxID=1737510 RepID=A0A8J4GSH1_9CHLO|nr:hypothetical protein Vretifemale_12950 [Volvox reticuliferus]GIM12690.1 hypothetical protein Vretimale_15988 [Volvox reticuliferus]
MSLSLFLLGFFVGASIVHSQLNESKNTDYLEIHSGAEISRALADTGGPEVLVLANDYTLWTENHFAGLALPVVLQRNVTIQGRPDRWATLNTTHTKKWLRLGDGVTLLLRWVILFDLIDDVSSGASAELVTDMANGTTGMLALHHAAYSAGFCYPAVIVTDYLVRTLRPSSIPGTNKYNATSTIPWSLQAMGGGLGDFDSLGDGGRGAFSCTNNTLAPPMRRCWGHVAYVEDFATQGGTFNGARQFVPNGYYVYLKDAYMLCSQVLDIACVFALSPYGCLMKAIRQQQTPFSSSSSSDSVPTMSSEGSMAPPPQSAGGGPSSPSQEDDRGRKSTTVVLASALSGGFVAVAVVVAIFVVKRLRQQRRQRDTAKARANAPYGGSGADGMTGEDGSSIDTRPSGGGCLMISRRLPAAKESDDGGGGAGGGGGGDSATAEAPVGGRTAAAAAATKTTPNNSSYCDTGSDLVAGKASHTNAGASPPLSDLLFTDEGTGRSSLEKARLERKEAKLRKQQRQQQQQQDLPYGEDLPSRPVVVTPFTPLRPDLQLCQDLGQEVTLLPVVRGKGSYGKVCEGMYSGQRVAVKLVRDFLAGSEHNASDKIMRTFAQEVEVLGRCEHPNVVRLLAACMQPPRMCLVMELMETSLQRLVFGGSAKGLLLPLPKVLHIGCEIARALEYLHPTIVHRDLKPDNVLISIPDSPEPIVKVSDFGLSRLRCTVSPTMHPEAGTPSYMAPECFDLDVSCITHHVDIFSWAVVMWTMLSGVEPWAGYGIVEIAYKVTLLDERLMFDRTVALGRCPPRLQRLLTRCWNRTPERRPAAAEIVKEMILIMQQQDRPITRPDMESNYMASPGSVLNRIREYQDAAAAVGGVAATTTTTSTTITTTTTTTIITVPTASTSTADDHGCATAAATAAIAAAAAAADAYVSSSTTVSEGVRLSPEAAAMAVMLPPPSTSTSPLPPAFPHSCMGSGGPVSPYAPFAIGAAAAVNTATATATATSCKHSNYSGTVVNANELYVAVNAASPDECFLAATNDISGHSGPCVTVGLGPPTVTTNPVDSGTASSRGRTRWFTAESVRAALFGSRC